jgi:hypothetical protein
MPPPTTGSSAFVQGVVEEPGVPDGPEVKTVATDDRGRATSQ